MACGCGGKCCGQPKGLGFLPGESGGGDGDTWEGDWYLGGDGGGGSGDLWGFDNSYWQGDYGSYYDPASDAFVFTGNNASFLPSGQQPSYGSGDSNWQGLLDLWNELTGAITGNQGGNDTNSPALPGYCPGGYYHPLNDPFACVPFPPNTDAQTRQRATAAGNAANAAAKAAQAKAQQSQGCPPNTGLVKNAQGQCVCPPGYAPNAQLKKCVLVNASLAAQANQAPNWLLYALLALGVVVVVKR